MPSSATVNWGPDAVSSTPGTFSVFLSVESTERWFPFSTLQQPQTGSSHQHPEAALNDGGRVGRQEAMNRAPCEMPVLIRLSNVSHYRVFGV